MGVRDALGVAGRPGGVTQRGGVVLVQSRPVELIGLAGEQVVPAVHGNPVAERLRISVADHHDVPDRRQLVEHAGEQRDQRAVHDDDPVLGVVGDVRQLLGEQPQVQCVQHRAHAGHGQVGDQVLGVVPHQGGDPLVAGDPEVVGQGVGELCALPPDLAVAHPARGGIRPGPGDDLGGAVHRSAMLKNPRHQERRGHHRAAHAATVMCARSHRLEPRVEGYPST
jgi:hypothetical protein